MPSDLETAFHFADLADTVTLGMWRATGVASRSKADGSPVTEADIAAEQVVLRALRSACPGDGFLGEETGEYESETGRRWIVDGIDGTRFFTSGQPTWGTLIALEIDGVIAVGVSSSPAQERRWWAVRGEGAFSGSTAGHTGATRLTVSAEDTIRPKRLVTLPAFAALEPHHQCVLKDMASGQPVDRPWSHQNLVAEGTIDACVWFAGDVWDHAAPSILVEEAGGRFSDHRGGRRLDTRTAIYSNGLNHDGLLAALAPK